MNAMNRTQKEILFNWGDEDYEETIERLYQVRQLTVEWPFRDQITITICRLLMLQESTVYTEFFKTFRKQMEETKAREKMNKKRRNYRAHCRAKEKRKALSGNNFTEITRCKS